MKNEKIGLVAKLAYKLLNRLPKEADDNLRVLLLKAEEGNDVTLEIIDLLSSHANTLDWMREKISDQNGASDSVRGYGALAGSPNSISALSKWSCSIEDCMESLPVIQEGEDAPACGVHHSSMVRSQKKKGGANVR